MKIKIIFFLFISIITVICVLFSESCKKDDSDDKTPDGGDSLPTLTTVSIYSITQNSAQIRCEVTSDGGIPVTTRGVCWNTYLHPTILDSITVDGDSTGVYTSNLSLLIPSTIYYVRAYAKNSKGIVYGNELSFTTLVQHCQGIPTVYYNGQIYHTVQIGNQCWLIENLNVGTRINGSKEQTDNGIIEKYCYKNDHANCDIYGGLYQWNELMQYTNTQGTQGICPPGWHIPTDKELTTLISYLGGEDFAGGRMKEVNTTHWLFPNTGATNSKGFTALPGGFRNSNRYFYLLKSYAHFSSSTEYSSNLAWYRNLNYFSDDVLRYHGNKQYGYSVRCLKD